MLQQTISEQRRLREAEVALRNKRTGVALFQISWIMAFVCLIIVNWQLRYSAPTWPPPGVQPLERALPTLATLGLILSGWLVQRAHHAIQGDQRGAYLVQWRAALILGGVFVAVMAYEWLALPPVPELTLTILGQTETGPATQFNTIFRVMTAFHGFHALVIGLYMANVLRKAQGGAYGSHDAWEVEAGAKLWYFVVIAWMMFYSVLYWI